MELKGCTLFYAACDRDGKKLHPEKKLDLSLATDIDLIRRGHKEIHIVTSERKRWIRVPVDIPGPSIKQWYEAIKNNQRRNIKGVIKITLIRGNKMPFRESHETMYVAASVLGKDDGEAAAGSGSRSSRSNSKKGSKAEGKTT